MNIEFEVLPAFLPLWENKARYFLLMGGRGAGRSTASSQFAVSKLPGNEYVRCAIMRAVHSDIRHSIWREIRDRIYEQEVEDAFHILNNDMRVNYGQNFIQAHGFRASSGSHSAKLKSLASYNTVIIEEAEEVSEADFMMLDDSLRTKLGHIQLILCYNSPPKNHWLIERFFDLEESKKAKGFYVPKLKKDANAIYIGGDFRDNISNLDPQTIKRYENYKKTKPDYYWQMIEGLVPETVRGKIYKGWELIDSVPKEAKLLRVGGDWGWYPDPVATIALYYYDGSYIVDGITFGNEIPDEVVAADIKNIPGGKRVRAVFGADEPKSIEEMAKNGVKAFKSISGPGSVDFRIKVTSEKKIKVVRKDDPVHGNWVWDAYNIYHWAEDKDGNPKGEPDHQGSDPMDAVSYAIADLTDKHGSGGVKVHKPKWDGYNRVSVDKKSGASKVRVNIPRPLR